MFITPNDGRRLDSGSKLSGLESLWQSLMPLRSTLRFMQTGAHPDDESSAALSFMAKSLGIQVTYCCAVRGEGGQNTQGPEKNQELGVLRSREMEAAAAQIPMNLYWLNTELNGAITDFGFSKSGEETLQRWGKDRLMEALVRAIRTTKPDALCPTFLDIPGQHGHHQAITLATLEAFRLAADEKAYPEHFADGLTIWQASQLLLPAWGGGDAYYDDELPPPPTDFTLATDRFLPEWGGTAFQLGEKCRQFHARQEMGYRLSEMDGRATPFHVLKGDKHGLLKQCSG